MPTLKKNSKPKKLSQREIPGIRLVSGIFATCLRVGTFGDCIHPPLIVKSIRLLALFLSLTAAQAEVKLSKVFTPHMVLQRDMPVPVWGTAAAGESVSVSFAGQTQTATADAKGQWRVKLMALKASSTPSTLTVGTQKIDDVLVGDVWIGSGQSNMDMDVSRYIKDDAVLDAAAKLSYPKLRLLKKGAGAVWETATPESITRFSALLFSFGHALSKDVDVPIGLMVGAESGTPSGFWLSEEMYHNDAACAAAVKQHSPSYKYDELAAAYQLAKAKYDTELAAWKLAADAAKKAGKKVPRGPRGPQAVGKPGEANTGEIGQLFEAYIRPYVGYAIKGVLWDQGESLTNIACVPQYELMGALIKGWRNAWGQGDFPFIYMQKPSGGGCAWDYSNPIHIKADAFRPQPAAIPAPPAPDYSHAYFATFMQHPNTHMALSSDLGAGNHPILKSAYGERAALVAKNVAYGSKAEFLGPMYASHDIHGSKVTLKFTHTGKGLAFKNGDKLQGFMVAGADKNFVWADAAIDGATIIVSSKDVPQPVAVRYAWSDQFPWANLFNQDGLPAIPFRTDSW